jgi:hypothetical protein
VPIASVDSAAWKAIIAVRSDQFYSIGGGPSNLHKIFHFSGQIFDGIFRLIKRRREYYELLIDGQSEPAASKT